MSGNGSQLRLPFGNKNTQRDPMVSQQVGHQGESKRPLGDRLVSRSRLAVPQIAQRSRSGLSSTATVCAEKATLALTPKKRSVPVDDIHCRNTVDTPSKRSRSSTDGNSTSQRTDSTGSGSLARGIGGITMDPKLPTRQTSTASARKAIPAGARRSTTKRISKESHMSAAERAERERHKTEYEEKLRAHFMADFPTFVFYIDDPSALANRDIIKDIQRHGGTIEPFFSKKVTHVIASTIKTSVPSETRLKTSLSTSALQGNKQVPVHSDLNPFETRIVATLPKDMYLKARSFQMHVWDLEKITKILNLLSASRAHNKPTHKSAGKPELSQMLKQEKLLNLAERDQRDIYYFPQGSHYFLVEDATGEHRCIMAREFVRPSGKGKIDSDEVDKEGDDKQEKKFEHWPTIYGELEGRCPFTKYEHTRDDVLRRKKATQSGTLRRTVSMNNFHRNRSRSASPRPESRDPYARAASPYLAASGNSVRLTSHITSASGMGSSASFTSFSHMTPHDKRLAVLGRRAHVRGGSHKPTSGLAIGGVSRPATPEMTSGVPNVSAPFRGGTIRRMLGMDAVRTNPHHMDGMRRTVSHSVVPQATVEKDKKDGHCENCRENFSDFDSHISTEKHRAFATNSKNFRAIDQLIARCARPILEINAQEWADLEYAYDDQHDIAMKSAEAEPQWQDYHMPAYDCSGDADVSGNVESVSSAALHSAATSFLIQDGELDEDASDDEDSAVVDGDEEAQGGSSAYADHSMLEDVGHDADNSLRRERTSITPATSPVADDLAVIQEVKTARPGYVPSMMETRSRRARH